MQQTHQSATAAAAIRYCLPRLSMYLTDCSGFVKNGRQRKYCFRNNWRRVRPRRIRLKLNSSMKRTRPIALVSVRFSALLVSSQSRSGQYPSRRLDRRDGRVCSPTSWAIPGRRRRGALIGLIREACRRQAEIFGARSVAQLLTTQATPGIPGFMREDLPCSLWQDNLQMARKCSPSAGRRANHQVKSRSPVARAAGAQESLVLKRPLPVRSLLRMKLQYRPLQPEHGSIAHWPPEEPAMMTQETPRCSGSRWFY